MPDTEATQYTTRLTGKVLAFSIVPLLSVALLFRFGWNAAGLFVPGDPARWLFAGLPLLVAGLVLLCAVATGVSFVGRTIQVADQTVIYKDLRKELHLDIASLGYAPPGEGFLRTLRLSDGNHKVTVPQLFLPEPEFSRLVAELESARRRAKAGRGDASYSL